MNNFDETNRNAEDNDETGGRYKVRIDSSDVLDIVKILIGIVFLTLMTIACWFALKNIFKDMNEYESYISVKSVSAGIISDKEIINGHTANGGGIGYYDGKVGYNFNNNKSYIPTIYRIHISAEFEYEGETQQGSNYFDVSEDIYNFYNIGDYFDSRDLLGYAKEDETINQSVSP